MREVRRRRRQQIEEAVVKKKSAVPTRLAQILLLDLMLRFSLLPHFFSSLKLYESLLLSFHPLAFGTNTTEEERRRIMHNFQGLCFNNKKKTDQLKRTATESKAKAGKKVMREKKEVMPRHYVDPTADPHRHQRNQT